MNYEKIYSNLIKSRVSNPPNGYSEKHHINPKCLGGDNSKSNIVKLSAREHYIAHKLLCKIYPKNYRLSFALLCMSSSKSKSAVGHNIKSSDYEIARIRHSKILSENHPMKGAKLSESRRKQISDTSPRLSGQEHPMFGKKHSNKTKEKMSISSKRLSGNNHPMFGKKQSEESRQKMSESSKMPISKKIFSLKNEKTGETFCGLRWDFCIKYGFSASCGNVSNLLSGKIRIMKGWTLI